MYLCGGVGAIVACLTEQVALAIRPPVARESPIWNHGPFVCASTTHLWPHLVCVWCTPPALQGVLGTVCGEAMHLHLSGLMMHLVSRSLPSIHCYSWMMARSAGCIASAHECCALSLLQWSNTITHLFSYIMGRGSNAAMKGSGGGADTALNKAPIGSLICVSGLSGMPK